MTNAENGHGPGDMRFALPHRPRLRALDVQPVTHEDENFMLFHDREGVAPDTGLSVDFEPLLRLLDGRRTPAEISAAYAAAGGENLPEAWLTNFLEQLDGALLLESDRYETAAHERLDPLLNDPVHAAAFAGRAYPGEPAALRCDLNGYITGARQLLDAAKPLPSAGSIRGCIVPHIDFRRGGIVEALAYEGLQNERFDTLVILGIAHAGVRYPFSLLAQDFETPLGTAACDRAFCAALQGRLDERLTAEPYAHRKEHSLEFVAVFAQHCQNLCGAKIVPIICGGFFSELANRTSPAGNADVAAFAAALRQTSDEWAETGQRVGVICSVDGAHVGSNFGDDTPLSPARLANIREADLAAWRAVEAGDREAFHAELARDNNARHVDAHPAVYTTLLAFPEWRAHLLHYDQAYSERENSVVSFAALALYEN